VSARATTTSPVAPRGKQETATPPPHAAHARLRLSGRAALLLFAVFLVTMLAIAPTRVYLEQRGRLQRLEQQAAQLEEANAELGRRIADLRDPVTLERLARQCLGLVEPGEIAIITVPRRGAPNPADC